MDWIKFGLYSCLLLSILLIILFAVGFYYVFSAGYVIHNDSGEDVLVTYVYSENNTDTSRTDDFEDILIKKGKSDSRVGNLIMLDHAFRPGALIVKNYSGKRCIFALNSIHAYDLIDSYYSIPPLNDKRCKLVHPNP
jgi:hypothetical protein